MADAGLSQLVLFIASLLIAAGVVGAAFTGVDQVTVAMEDRSVLAAEELRADVTIISDPGADGIYDNATGQVILLVKNTGATALTADTTTVEVLVNGGYVSASDLGVSVVDGGDSWHRGGVVRLEIETDGLDPGDHRVLVNVHGNEDVIEFRVEAA